MRLLLVSNECVLIAIFSDELLLYLLKEQYILLILVFAAINIENHLYLVFPIYILRKRYIVLLKVKLKTEFLILFLKLVPKLILK